MSWNQAIEQEYDEMLVGEIRNALEYSSDVETENVGIPKIKNALEKLENGNFEEVKIEPENDNYLNYDEVVTLHAMRVACCLWAERAGIFPWKLVGKSAEELKPLLSFNYQGFMLDSSSTSFPFYTFHGIWEVKPGERLLDAITFYQIIPLLAVFGCIDSSDIPVTEEQMIYFLIQQYRDAGWRHEVGYTNEYAGYPDYRMGLYDYEAVSEVKAGQCHRMSEYLVTTLRSYNIPAHVGPGWGSELPPGDYLEYEDFIHKWGHCYIHFNSIGKWFSHGDDVYNKLLKTLPIELSFRSESWMFGNFFNATEYQYKRAQYWADYYFWCLHIGESADPQYDVMYLYKTYQLRNKLDTLHEGRETREGAPDMIPPILSPDEVAFLMDWVRTKIGDPPLRYVGVFPWPTPP